jgi:hypothetical protein
MDIKDVMNKLDTYIKGYSKLLEENNLLKERLNMYDTVVETSTISVKNALDKVEKTEMILETYMENVNIVFDGLNSILESMIEKESVSLEELEQLKLGIKKLKDNLNKPTNE